MTHRILARDGYHECFACGTKAEIVSDRDTDADLNRAECRPGGWEHPQYLIGTMVETCTAHETYECSHVAEPYGPIWGDSDEDHVTSTCGLCGLPIEWDPRNHWTHASLEKAVPA